MKISQKEIWNLMKAYFKVLGSPDKEAEIMADELLSANLCGMDSHGVLRLVEYTEHVEKGIIHPGAPIQVNSNTVNSAIVDVGGNFGQVGARVAVDIALEKASAFGMSVVVTKRSNHVGRLGSYTERIAQKGLLAFAVASQSDTLVAPWGSSEGRMGTNPISYAVPSESGTVVMDIATTACSVGKLRIAADKGEQIPEEILIDKNGQLTTNPNDLFDGGALLPLGGAAFGHKGFALSVMCEAFGTILAGEERVGREKAKWNNTLCLITIDPNIFYGREDYSKKMAGFVKYIKASKPANPDVKVIMPGEFEHMTYERRKNQDIYLPDKTWEDIEKLLIAHGVCLHRHNAPSEACR